MILSDNFNEYADELLEFLLDSIEEQDGQGELDIDIEDGSLAIEDSKGNKWLLTKNNAAQELWLASPISGGLHFKHESGNIWKTLDDKILLIQIAEEISTNSNINFTFK